MAGLESGEPPVQARAAAEPSLRLLRVERVELLAIPIPGTFPIGYLAENMAVLSIKLMDEQYDRLSLSV